MASQTLTRNQFLAQQKRLVEEIVGKAPLRPKKVVLTTTDVAKIIKAKPNSLRRPAE